MNKVKLGGIYQGEVVDYTYDGQGIVKIDGFCVFIENVIIEEIVEFVVVDVKKNLSFGRLTKIIKKSLYRVEPKCSYYYVCGGCNLMHMNYQAQVEFKKNYVINELNKKLNLELDDIKMIFSNNKYRYRNKLIVPFDYVNGTVRRGLYKKQSHDIIENLDCLISDKSSYELVNLVYQYILEKSYFNNIKNVLVRVNKDEELMLVVISKTKLNSDFVDYILSKTNNIVSIVNNINDKDTNVVLGEKNITLFGEDYYYDELLENKFKVSSKSFFQVNRIQTEKLYSSAIELLEIKKSSKVIDLYSGIGSIGLSVASKVNKVLGIEVVSDAVEMAKENAKINNISNAEFICGKAEDLLEKHIKNYDTLIVDPPRKGLDNKLKETIIKNNVEKLVYISCNPSTFVRDVKDLGFTLKDIVLCDMFINTYHIEIVALLEKN